MAESSKKNKKGNRHSHNRPDEKIRLPKGEELFGIVDTRLGMGKSRIRCSDGKERICRVPGALKRRLWVRPNNIVIIKPWEYEGDRKGDEAFDQQEYGVRGAGGYPGRGSDTGGGQPVQD